ncbi:MAG: undecaprenyl-diphosphate phosphatase [Phycisphaerales bacterium]
MELWQAAILGLVEGITEYLPVSSTGHLILASSLLGLDGPERKGALNAFQIVIQGGAILAVLGLYWPRVVQMLRGLLGRDPAGLRLAINLAVAFAPAAVIGVLLNDWIESRLFFVVPVVSALAAGGIYMILIGRLLGRRPGAPPPPAGPDQPDPLATMTPPKALAVGLMQCIAMWPGVSRSMMTITGGMIVGLPAAAAAEFSFLLGLPTLGGATVYRLVKDVWRSDGGPNMFESLGWGAVLIGMAVAAVAAAVAVRWLVAFLNRHGLAVFGWYRLGLAAVLAGLALAGAVRIAPDSPGTPVQPGPAVLAGAPP